MTEQIKVTGVSQRKFAKLVGCHHSYIGRLVREGKIPVNADGTIDPAQAKRARSANTVVGRNRQLNQGRRPPLSRVLDRHCDGCGGLYSSALARELGSSNVRSFCSRECAADVLAGRT